MSIFSFLRKKKVFFSDPHQEEIVKAIQKAEKATSGEIRVYVESKFKGEDPMERAKAIFFKLKMQQTAQRNAVLLYIAMDRRQLALYADQGIYQAVGAEYWNKAVQSMLKHFTASQFHTGIVACIGEIGAALQEKFPYDATTDKNELPDEIVFGK